MIFLVSTRLSMSQNSRWLHCVYMSDRYLGFWPYHSLCLNGPLPHREVHTIDSHWNSSCLLGVFSCVWVYSLFEMMCVADCGAWAGHQEVATSHPSTTSLSTWFRQGSQNNQFIFPFRQDSHVLLLLVPPVFSDIYWKFHIDVIDSKSSKGY